MTNKTKRFMKRCLLLAVVTLGMLYTTSMVALAKPQLPEKPTAVWWDEKPDKAGVARCNEVNGAEKYNFKLYREGDLIVTRTSPDNHYDFARDLAECFYDRKNANYYVKAQAVNETGMSKISEKSAGLKKEQWIELFYYCYKEDIEIKSRPETGTVSTIDVYVKSEGFQALPTISVGNGCKIEKVKWSKTTALKVGQRVTAMVTIIPEGQCEILLSKGKESIKLQGSDATLYQYQREGQSFNLEIDYIVPGRLETPTAVWWDEKSTKAGVARCNEVEYATEYTFTLYVGSERITVTTENNYYDFAKELAKNYCNRSKGIYFTVQVSSNHKAIQKSCVSSASNNFTQIQWNDLLEYCEKEGIKVS